MGHHCWEGKHLGWFSSESDSVDSGSLCERLNRYRNSRWLAYVHMYTCTDVLVGTCIHAACSLHASFWPVVERLALHNIFIFGCI